MRFLLISMILVIVSLAIVGCGGASGVYNPMTITPGSTTLAPGQTMPFLGVSKMGTNPSYFNWQATGGTYTVSGDHSNVVYTAGAVEGTFKVSVTSSLNSNHTAQATVTIKKP